MESGSDRIGALDFQAAAQTYEPRSGSATLEELQTAAERLMAGLPPTLALDAALEAVHPLPGLTATACLSWAHPDLR